MTTLDIQPEVAGITGEPAPVEYRGRDFDLSASAVRTLHMVLMALLALRVLGMVTVPFTDTTEARYAEIARIMVETGNWITPQFDYGVPFWGKPPLHTWLAAGGMRLFGINEFAARLPIFLTTLGVLALIYHWVKEIVGRNAALLSVCVLASMGLFFGAAGFVMTDMVMVLGTTLAMVGFWQAAQREKSAAVWGYAVFVGLAIGLMAKGPVAVVLSGIPIVGWVVMARQWHALRTLPWLPGLALTCVLVLPWYVAAEYATPGFLRYFIIGEHFERFVVPGWQGDLYGTAHIEPKGQIWAFWFTTIFPWTFVPVALAVFGRRVLDRFRRDGSGWLLYLLLWSLSPMILFTPAGNILHAYTLPGLPAAAVLFVVLSASVWSASPGWPARALFGLAVAILLVTFGALATVAGLSPNTINMKSHKELVATARARIGDAPFYSVGGRSFSASFYTHGAARVASVPELADLAARPGMAALSVPKALAAQVATLNFDRVGQFGRHVLFIKRTGEVTE